MGIVLGVLSFGGSVLVETRPTAQPVKFAGVVSNRALSVLDTDAGAIKLDFGLLDLIDVRLRQAVDALLCGIVGNGGITLVGGLVLGSIVVVVVLGNVEPPPGIGFRVVDAAVGPVALEAGISWLHDHNGECAAEVVYPVLNPLELFPNNAGPVGALRFNDQVTPGAKQPCHLGVQVVKGGTVDGGGVVHGARRAGLVERGLGYLCGVLGSHVSVLPCVHVCMCWIALTAETQHLVFGHGNGPPGSPRGRPPETPPSRPGESPGVFTGLQVAPRPRSRPVTPYGSAPGVTRAIKRRNFAGPLSTLGPAIGLRYRGTAARPSGPGCCAR